MIPRAALAELGGTLAEASDKKILSLIGLLDRLPNATQLEPVLERVRPRLGRLRPPRPLKLPRLLLLPIEDLLVPPKAWQPGSPTIPRSAPAALIAAGLAHLPRDVLEAANHEAEGHSATEFGAVARAGSILWPASAESFLRAAEKGLPPGVSDPGMRPEDFSAACRDAAFLLHAAPRLVALRAQPAPTLDPAAIAVLRAVLMEAATHGEPTLARAIATLMAGFLSRAPLLELVRDAARKLSSTERSPLIDAALAAGFERAAGPELPEDLAATDLARRTRAALDAVSAIDAMLRAQQHIRTARRDQVRARGQEIEQLLRGHLAEMLPREVVRPFAALAAQDTVSEAEIAAIEAAARSLRSIAQAGRKLAPTDAYPRAMRDALEDVATIGLEVSARRGKVAASGLTHADAVRLAEIIAGPDDAWTMLGLLKARAA